MDEEAPKIVVDFLTYLIHMYRTGISSEAIMAEINKYSEIFEELQSAPDKMRPHGRPNWTSREHIAIVEEIVALYRDGAFPVTIYPRLEKLDRFWHENNFPCLVPHGIREKRREERDAETKDWWKTALPDKPTES